MSGQPLISIGMPVYNGGVYLREALESVLAQEYPHFELIISDDASTDDTEAICREYAAKDQRIRYYRHTVRLLMYKNFKQAFDYAQGEYFLWFAHDDIWHPAYLKELLALLLQHESAVLAGCQVTELLPDKSHSWLVPLVPATLRMTRMERMTSYIENTPHAICHLIYGLFRRQVLARSKALKLADASNDPKIGFDHLIIFDCLAQGDIVVSEQPLFLGRVGGTSYYFQENVSLLRRVSMFVKFSFFLHRCFEWSHFSLFEKVLLLKACCVNDIKHVIMFCKQVYWYHLKPYIRRIRGV
jgi:glycosyltransferase involved in cell wall biosynthesis